MDEFKSEDELRPDSSDRRAPRQRKGPSVPKVAMSRQHLMIGIGILVLLLLVISIGSALKSPTPSGDPRQPTNAAGGEKNINLSGETTEGGNSVTPTPDAPQSGAVTAPGAAPDAGMPNTVNGSNGQPSQPQELSAPPVASSPTQAPPITTPSGQQRIELPGNMTDALSQQGDRVNGMSSQMTRQGASSTLPTAPATVAPSARESAHKAPASTTPKSNRPTTMVPSATNGNSRSASAAAPAAKAPANRAAAAAPTVPAAGASSATASAGGAVQSAPSGYYTLQLSSASQPATLNAYAKKQQLSQYWVYETRRDGRPWYVLVSGVYPTASQAKSAVAQLPADVQAKKPWARQVGQVKQDQNK